MLCKKTITFLQISKCIKNITLHWKVPFPVIECYFFSNSTWILNLFAPRGRQAAVWGGGDRPEWWRGRAPTRRCIRPPRPGPRRCTLAPPLLRPWTKHKNMYFLYRRNCWKHLVLFSVELIYLFLSIIEKWIAQWTKIKISWFYVSYYWKWYIDR